jgi:type IV conjugative transfer system coupling protein TraD
MFMQVVNRSLMVSLLSSIAVIGLISYVPATKLHLTTAMTYQKALLADDFDHATSSIRTSINSRNKYYFTRIDAYDQKGLFARDIDPRKIINSNLFKASYIEVLNFLKVRLLMVAGTMVGIFLLIYLLWSRFGKEIKAEKKQASSWKILSTAEISVILNNSNKASHFKIGGMPLVKDMETRHFLVTGSTGSGKTNLIHNLLLQVERKGQPVIIIDQTGEMIAKYYSKERGDIIFNPFDARGHAWDFWTDCNAGEDLERFSKILLGFNRKQSGNHSDPFWEQSAEIIFNACAQYLYKFGDPSIEQLTDMVRNTPLNILQKQLAGTEAACYLVSESKTTTSSILSVLSTSTKPLDYLIDKAASGTFSLKQYFANIKANSGSSCNSSPNPWLFLATKPSARALTLPLIACLTELALSELMNIGMDNTGTRRVWFVIDELASLGKLPALSSLMTEGRKYGACVIAGLQSLNQLYANYGQYAGSTIFGQFGTSFFFRNNEPTIAKIVSSMCGSETITRQQKSTSFGANEFRDGVSYSEQQQRKELVEYADIANLATGECFALLPEPQVRIAKIQTDEAKLADKNDGFVQREEKKVAKVVHGDTKAIKQTRETASIQEDAGQSVN